MAPAGGSRRAVGLDFSVRQVMSLGFEPWWLRIFFLAVFVLGLF